MDLSSVPAQILYQGIGIVALVFSVLSFQSKKLKTVLIMQCIASVFWSIHFVIGQAYSAFFMNLLCIGRSLGFAYIEEKKKRLGFVVIISTLFVLVATLSVVMLQEKFFIAIANVAGSIVGNIFFYLGNNKKYKIAQFFFISPCWLFNNIWYLSIGGICCESLNMISIIVSFVRTKLEERRKKLSNNNGNDTIDNPEA